jgi:predicted lysophospholipase L1 biosynthesis ABC-type transport system permease subunit
MSLVPGGVLVDQQLADIYQLKIGNEIKLGDKKFRVMNIILKNLIVALDL